MSRKNGVASAVFVKGKHVGPLVPTPQVSDGMLSRAVARSPQDDKTRIVIEVGRRKVEITHHQAWPAPGMEALYHIGTHLFTKVDTLTLGEDRDFSVNYYNPIA